MKSFDTVSQAISDLQLRGYIHDFALRGDHVFCDAKDLRLTADQFQVDEVYRFEGDTDPGDENVVYAISASHQSIKGVLVLAYGVYAEEASMELLQKLKYNPKP